MIYEGFTEDISRTAARPESLHGMFINTKRGLPPKALSSNCVSGCRALVSRSKPGAKSVIASKELVSESNLSTSHPKLCDAIEQEISQQITGK